MDAYRVAVADADLSNLIQRVGAGEHVILTQDGHPVAELHPPARQRHNSPEAGEALRRLLELRDSLPPLPPGMSSLDVLDELNEEREEAIGPLHRRERPDPADRRRAR